MSRNRVKWTWTAILLLCLLAIVLLAALGGRGESDREPAPDRPVPVRVLVVEPRDIVRRLEVIGRVEPSADILLAAEQPGVVRDVPADKGQFVSRGDLLLQIDDTLARIAVDEARLLAEEAARERERQRELFGRGAIPLRDDQAADTREQLARAALERAETLLAKRRILSPADGWIEERVLEPGDYAREGDPAFRLLDLSSVKIAFDVPERDLRHLRVGRRVPFRVDAWNGEEFAGELVFLSGRAAPENNAFSAELLAPNPDGRLRPGMLARLTLELDRLPGAVAVPIHAVVPQRGRHVVFVEDGGRAERRAVRLREIQGREAVLESGLQPGDRLVVEGQRTLLDGQPVEIVPDGAAPAGSPRDAAP